MKKIIGVLVLAMSVMVISGCGQNTFCKRWGRYSRF